MVSADLGLSTEVGDESSVETSIAGSRYWLAPEMLRGEGYNVKVFYSYSISSLLYFFSLSSSSFFLSFRFLFICIILLFIYLYFVFILG
jgi:serine/threonine protein kinase